jgi:phosphate butyryltransferase
MIGTLKEIIDTAHKTGAPSRAVISLPGAQDVDILGKAAAENLITPLLVGNGSEIENLVQGTLLASCDFDIADVQNEHEALSISIAKTRGNDADILLQGGIDHSLFIKAVLDRDAGLLNGKAASYASVYQLKKRDKLILVTDTYINNFPTLREKQLILENVLTLARFLEFDSPKVAALASIEQVNPSIHSTLDAAILSKMSQRKQFGNVIVEGPLDIDCALDHQAAERKGVHSEVTGNVDIYLVPDIDVGYLLAQLLVFIGKMPSIGVLLGTAKPVILRQPFVAHEDRVAEIALAVMMSEKGE